jgi:serine/threonine-protein kinase RsbW
VKGAGAQRKLGRRPQGATGGGPSVRISIPSETSYLGLVRDLAKKMAEIAGFDESTAGRVALAVDEATTNVIEHAYRGNSDKEVELRFEDRGPELRVDIVDTGATVDRRSIPAIDITRFASEGRTGGLGVHLMEKIMDSVTFRRTAHQNVCRLVKRKDSRGR